MAEKLISIKGVSKSFGATLALQDINFSINEGEVHVLLGENGAGKSTLMKILSGMHSADTGEVYWKGNKVEFKSPVDALNHGIAMVYQELALVPEMNAIDNILLGQLPLRKRNYLIDWNKAKKQAKEILKSLDQNIDINKPVRLFSLGICQLIEIAKVISRNSKLIILDEPTSALSLREVESLFFIINKLKKRGISFIYITHKLNEVFTIGDRVTILRDGCLIKTLDTFKEDDKGNLISLMVGRELSDHVNKENNLTNEVQFNVNQLTTRKNLKNITFKVHKGEILGIAGIMGSGMSELAETLYGLRKCTDGIVQISNKTLKKLTPEKAIMNKMGLLRNDRKKNLMLHMSISQNITVSSKEKCVKNGFRIKSKENKLSEEYVRKLRIISKNIKSPVSSLSGGNQQKVAIARWLCNESTVLIFDDPTRGIDVGAKHEVYEIMNELTKNGASIIFISSELPELIGMSDRVLVMRNGELVAEFDKADVTQEKIMYYAAGAY